MSLMSHIVLTLHVLVKCTMRVVLHLRRGCRGLPRCGRKLRAPSRVPTLRVRGGLPAADAGAPELEARGLERARVGHTLVGAIAHDSKDDVKDADGDEAHEEEQEEGRGAVVGAVDAAEVDVEERLAKEVEDEREVARDELGDGDGEEDEDDDEDDGGDGEDEVGEANTHEAEDAVHDLCGLGCCKGGGGGGRGGAKARIQITRRTCLAHVVRLRVRGHTRTHGVCPLDTYYPANHRRGTPAACGAKNEGEALRRAGSSILYLRIPLQR